MIGTRRLILEVGNVSGGQVLGLVASLEMCGKLVLIPVRSDSFALAFSFRASSYAMLRTEKAGLALHSTPAPVRVVCGGVPNLLQAQ